MIKKNANAATNIPASEKYVSGKVSYATWIDEGAAGCHISTITFEPGARTHWHSHPTVQILIAESGKGYVQKQGEAADALLPGDMMIILPGEEHWHGASPDCAFTHTAVQMVSDDAEVLTKVTEEQYQAIK